MNLLNPKNIEELVISALKTRGLSGERLLAAIRERRPKTTKQAMYLALRKMKKEEIVVAHGGVFSLSSVWMNNMINFFSVARNIYTREIVADEGFLNLSDGDRISYTFKNPHVTDAFWGHAFDILADVTPITEPIYIYNPHEWFFLARHETERALFDRILKTGKQILLLCGNRELLDLHVSKEFDGGQSQYYASTEKVFAKNNYYVNVFGDYILEVLLDEKTANKIDAFYCETKSWDNTAQAKIISIVQESGRNRLTISKNKNRAEKLKKILGKHFFVKKN